MSVKRNTTPMLLVKVHMPFEKVRRIEFLFKKRKMDKFPELLRKVYDADKGEIPIREGEDTEESFTVLCQLTAEETLRFPEGVVYMDTRPVLYDGTIPNTEIVEISVTPTLFGEVNEDD